MKKILLHYPLWQNRWIPYFKEELKSRYDLFVSHTVNKDELSVLCEECDVLLSMWLNGIVYYWAKEFPGKPIISYLRRYEIFQEELLKQMPWGNINALIFVNDSFRDLFRRQLSRLAPDAVNNGLPLTYLIYNGIDLEEYDMGDEFKPGDGTKIAFSCSAKPVKNLPLAAAILNELPEEYTLHHIGLPFGDDVFGGTTFGLYLKNLGLEERWIFEGTKKPHELPEWYKDKDYILSTSVSEGNPNNVIEAMAMGCKPIIHNWPGAVEQFGWEFVFNTPGQAVELIGNWSFEPLRYRNIVAEKYSRENFKQIHRVIDEVT